jgi:hypothetical protein
MDLLRKPRIICANHLPLRKIGIICANRPPGCNAIIRKFANLKSPGHGTTLNGWGIARGGNGIND